MQFECWKAEDWKGFRRIATDPIVVHYLGTGKAWPDERIQEFVVRQIANWRECGCCLWKLREKRTGNFIGICGLQPLAGTAEIEIGWWLGPARCGQGLAKEAGREVRRFGFEVAKLVRIVAIAQPANRASIRVMVKTGMIFEKETVHKGIPVVLYALTP